MVTLTLTDKQIAQIIGKPIIRGRIFWKTSDLLAVRIALRALRLTTLVESFQIDGVMPYWLYLAIRAALAPKRVSFNTPNHGAIEIPVNEPKGGGHGIAFSVFEDEKFTLVQFMTPRTLPVGDLVTIVPPVLNPEKGVVIASGAPFWVVATVAQAYATTMRWVACTQKGGGAIVAISNDRRQDLGAEICGPLIDSVIEKAVSEPQRGEIWMFNAGYGDHPCLIMSRNDRNALANDVLIVPFTTSKVYAHSSLLVLPVMTGLKGPSYAQFSKMGWVNMEHLIDGPLSTVTDDLMLEIMKLAKRAKRAARKRLLRGDNVDLRDGDI